MEFCNTLGTRLLGGWPGLLILGGTTKMGAPSLRFLQGRVRYCLYHVISAESKSGAACGIVPTLRKEREEWGTQSLGRASEITRAGPPGWRNEGSERT